MPRKKISSQSSDDAAPKQVPEVQVPGFVLGTTVAELVISKEGIRTFIMNRKGAISHTSKHRAPHFYYVPPDDTLAGSVVHFARDASLRYCQPHDLLQQIKDFIHCYLQLPPSYEAISALYVLLSWVYEFAPSLPYLRVIGDWGTGKTRFLQVVGSICFRPIFASGAATPAPIFRILDQYRGTLFLDEADFKESSAWIDMVKILNNGYRPGFPVLRADKVNGRWRPRGYQVFGPKLIATRFRFEDEALESRCLTAEMPVLTRSNIPRMFPVSFNDEVYNLRSKLLTFRLYNLFKLKSSEFTNDLLEPGLQPCLQEILMPLKALAGSDQYLSDTLSVFIKSQQESMYSRRHDTLEGLIVSAMLQLHSTDSLLTSDTISYCANDMDEDAGLTARKVGWIVKRLGFIKRRLGHDGRHVVVWDDELAFRLASKYGIPLSPSNFPEKNVTNVTIVTVASHFAVFSLPSKGLSPTLSPVFRICG